MKLGDCSFWRRSQLPGRFGGSCLRNVCVITANSDKDHRYDIADVAIVWVVSVPLSAKRCVVNASSPPVKSKRVAKGFGACTAVLKHNWTQGSFDGDSIHRSSLIL